MNAAMQPEYLQNDFEPVYYNQEILRREAVRYLFFPGDVIGARRKQEREDLAGGGEEIGSACLVRTKGFLRRCRITPLERWGELMPAELLPEGANVIGVQPTGMGSEQAFTSFKSNLFAFPKFPGEEITWIIQSADNGGIRKGIVELTALQAMEWKDFRQLNLQELFFPDYPNLPKTLREVEGMIRATGERYSSDPIIRRCAQEMLGACSIFRRWATARIEAENLLAQIGTTKDGWTYTYSDLADTLFAQIEMERVDHHLQNQARFQGTLAESQGRLVELVERAFSGVGQQAAGVDTTELITTLQRQMAEQQAVMMQQNQEFLRETLTRLFAPEAEGDAQKPKPGPNDGKGGSRK